MPQDIHNLEQLHNLMRYNPFLLDVRTIEEYCRMHICSAIHIKTPKPPLKDKDMKELENKLKSIGIKDKNKMIIVYCKLGIRAGIAKNVLEQIGYTNVKSLGGIETEPLKSILSGKINSPYLKVCQCSNQK